MEDWKSAFARSSRASEKSMHWQPILAQRCKHLMRPASTSGSCYSIRCVQVLAAVSARGWCCTGHVEHGRGHEKASRSRATPHATSCTISRRWKAVSLDQRWFMRRFQRPDSTLVEWNMPIITSKTRRTRDTRANFKPMMSRRNYDSSRALTREVEMSAGWCSGRGIPKMSREGPSQAGGQ